MTDTYFELSKQAFEAICRQLEAYSIQRSNSLELLRAKNIFPYYNATDGNIYLPNFDPDNPIGKLQLLLLRSLLSCDSDQELLEFLQVITPWMVAHEMGHHLRHYHGVMGENMWHEEQVANYLAFAITKHRLTMQQRAQLRQFLRRALEGLVQRVQSENVATISYGNILHALHASGRVDQATVRQLEMVYRIFDIDPQTMLISSRQISEDVIEEIQRRDAIIESINQEYTADMVQYLYYHLGWLHLGISSSESYYVEEFKQSHLDKHISLLSVVGNKDIPSVQQIQACFCASTMLTSLSPAAGQYFYKRYRSLLVKHLQAELGEHLDREILLLIERWDKQFDALNYLTELVSSETQRLLPNMIEQTIPNDFALEQFLLTETDVRLWQHANQPEQSKDIAAANTLQRLQTLDSTDIFHALSAEAALQIIQELYYVHLDEGEVLLRQGEQNNDVFILITGRLGVFQEDRNPSFMETLYGKLTEELLQPHYVGFITPGQVIGEMAFFTREARSASVHALEPSVCFVLKSSSLHMLAYAEPLILMQMASAISHRLNQMIRHSPRAENV